MVLERVRICTKKIQRADVVVLDDIRYQHAAFPLLLLKPLGFLFMGKLPVSTASVVICNVDITR